MFQIEVESSYMLPNPWLECFRDVKILQNYQTTIQMKMDKLDSTTNWVLFQAKRSIFLGRLFYYRLNVIDLLSAGWMFNTGVMTATFRKDVTIIFARQSLNASAILIGFRRTELNTNTERMCSLYPSLR